LSQVSEVIARERSRTASYLRTESQAVLKRIRDSLDPEERSLLVLRVDRNLSWLDIARIMRGGETDEQLLKRDAARLRKRFQTLKARLRARAREAGLHAGDGG
jgi:RNA polymerase sigma-70 factor (ECF subfamily)